MIPLCWFIAERARWRVTDLKTEFVSWGLPRDGVAPFLREVEWRAVDWVEAVATMAGGNVSCRR